MSKSRTQRTTQRTALDPLTNRFLERFRGLGLANATGSPENELLRQAGGISGDLAGSLGVAQERGLTGIEGFLDPFLQDVVGASQADFARQREGAISRAADVATGAGAFGGSRSAVLEALGVGDVNQQEAGTLARLRSAGFSDAANRLFGERQLAAQLGLSGLSGLTGIGSFLEQARQQRLAGLGGAIGPFQGTIENTERLRNSPFAGIGGGLLTGLGAGLGGFPLALAGGAGLLSSFA